MNVAAPDSVGWSLRFAAQRRSREQTREQQGASQRAHKDAIPLAGRAHVRRA